jgi:hypothetical protein
MSGHTEASTQSEETGSSPWLVPLFRVDPGWLFVIAGLAFIVAGVLIPAQRELHDLEQKLAVHRAFEARTAKQIEAYESFLEQINAATPDEALVRRLAASQLNRMPKDAVPLLESPTLNDTVPEWIEASVDVKIPTPVPNPDTILSRLATGPKRIWVLAMGAFLVFVGLMLAPSAVTARPRVRREPTPVDDAPNAASAVATMLAVDAPRVGVVDEVAGAVASDAPQAVEAVEVVEAVEAVEVLDPVATPETAVVEAEAAAVEVAGAAETAEAAAEPSTEAAAEPIPEAFAELAAEAEVPVAVVEIEEPVVPVVEVEADPESDPAIEAAIAEPETLCSAEGDFVTHEAQDVHELQYERVVEVTHAATEALPQELEVEFEAELEAELEAEFGAERDDQSLSVEAVDSAVDMSDSVIIEVPPANDRALDTMSLFAGIAEERWMRLGDSTASSRQS